MSRRKTKAVAKLPSSKSCCFCGSSEENEALYGKLWLRNGILTHYYCLLLSSNMEQNGNDNEGILGFLVKDILKELSRGKRLICFYCKRSGATLGCCNSRCKRVFHLPCGLQAGSLHQFFGEFRSFCIRHRINQDIDDHILEEAAEAGAVTCYICYEDVNYNDKIQTLWAPCCRKNAWFHRKCVQLLASSAGYFFKCPLCNNKQEFQTAMLENGIFIPNQDASWELVPNAFQELLHRHNHCDAAECVCPKGRNYTGVNAKWELVLCRLCGSQGIHKACGDLKWATSNWECADCVLMLKKDHETASLAAKCTKESRDEISKEESDSDSDISVGGNSSPLPAVIQCEDSLTTITSTFKLRPGPKSFKLRQAVQMVKSTELAAIGVSKTYVPASPTIAVSGVSNAVINDKILQGKSSLSMETTTTKINNVFPGEDNQLFETAHAKSKVSDHHSTDVIMIDSEDEIEIIDPPPCQNVLVTNNGIKIEVHDLAQSTIEQNRIDVSKFSTELKSQLPISQMPNSFVSSNGNLLSTTPSPTVTPQICQLNVSEYSIIGKNATDHAKGKSVQDTGSPNLIVLDETPSEDSVMNLKITNVTSLRPEYLANASAKGKINSGLLVFPGTIGLTLPTNRNQCTQTMQLTKPVIEAPSAILTTAEIHELNGKRKSQECAANETESNQCSGDILEQFKKPRIFEARDNINGGIPMTTPSELTACASNSTVLAHRAVPLKENCSKLQSNNTDSFRLQHIESVCKYTSGSVSTNLVQSKSNSKANNVTMEYGKPLDGIHENDLHASTQINSFIQPQLDKRKFTFTGQQSTVNGSQNLSQTASKLSIPKTSTQQVPKAAEGTIVMRKEDHQSSEKTNRKMPKHIQSVQMSQTNLNISEKSCKNQHSPGNMIPTGHSITLVNGKPIVSGCDGDAGSNPAAEARFDHQATSNSTVHVHAEPSTFDYLPEGEPGRKERSDYPTISTCTSAIPTSIYLDSSPATTRKYCDTTRIIPAKLPLKDLKFCVVNSDIVQMIVTDNLRLNLNVNTANHRNDKNVSGPKCAIKEQRLFLFSAHSKLNVTGNDCDFRDSAKRSAANNEHCTNTTRRRKELLSTRETMPSNKRALRSSHKKDGVKQIDNCRNRASLSGQSSYDRIARRHTLVELPSTNKLQTPVSFQDIKRNSVCAPQRKNNTFGVENSVNASETLNKNTVESVNSKDRRKSVSSIDFDNKKHNCLDNKDENRPTDGMNRVYKKCPLGKSHNSSVSNQCAKCYIHLKKIVECNSTLNCNKKDCAADVAVLPGNHGKNNVDVVAAERINDPLVCLEVVNCNENLCTPNSDESEVATVNTNYKENSSLTILRENSSNSNVFHGISANTPTSTVCKNPICSSINETWYNTRQFDYSIKVSIDLKKIQHFIHSKPQLFNKS